MKNRAVATGIKEDSEERDVEEVIEGTIRATGMKEVEYTIDCPAIPITHAFVEFRDKKQETDVSDLRACNEPNQTEEK